MLIGPYFLGFAIICAFAIALGTLGAGCSHRGHGRFGTMALNIAFVLGTLLTGLFILIGAARLSREETHRFSDYDALLIALFLSFAISVGSFVLLFRRP